jgi:hypothetical protein
MNRGASRWRRRAAIAVALLVVLALLFVATPLDEALVGWVVGRAAGIDLVIGRLEWPFFKPLRMEEVEARLPGASDPCFTAGVATLDVGLFPPRLGAVALERPRLIATEQEDGSFDVLALRGEGPGEPVAPPPLVVTGGLLELRGQGPFQRRLREFVADDVAAALAVDSLRIEPSDDGSAAITGTLKLCGVVPLELSASTQSGRLIGGSVRIDPAAPIDLAALKRSAAPELRRWLEENALEGRVVGAAQLIDAAGARVPSVDVEVEALALKPAAFPVALHGFSGRIELRDGNLVVEKLRGKCGDATLSIEGRVDDVLGRAAARVVARLDQAVLDEPMRAALMGDRLGRKFLEAFEPGGRYSCTATIESSREMAAPHLVLELLLEQMHGTFRGFVTEDGKRHGFPLKVERVQGLVVASNERSTFLDITGFAKSGARAEASGTIVGDTVEGDVEGEAIVIDADLLAAVEAELGPFVPRLVADLGATGTFAALARYTVDAAGNLALAIDLTPRAVTLQPKAFPFPSLLDAGVVRVARDGITIDGLSGRANGGTVRIDGRVGVEGDAPAFDVTTRWRAIECDAAFLAACAAAGGPEVEELLTRLAPSGRLDVSVRLVRAVAGGPIATEITIEPRGASLGLRAGVRIEAIEGAFTLARAAEGEPFSFDCETAGGLRGVACGGTVAVRGRSGDCKEGAFVATFGSIAIEAALHDALEWQAPFVARLVDAHEIRGTLRGRAVIALRDGVTAVTGLELSPDRRSDDPVDAPPSIRAAPPWIPLPLEWNEGVLRVELPEGRITFERLDGSLGEGRVTVGGGDFAPEEDGFSARLDVEIDALPFSEWLSLALGPARSAALAGFGPLGRTHAVIHELTFQLTDGGDTLRRLTATGAIDARGWTFYTGGALRELSGRLEVVDLLLERNLGTVADVRAEARLSGVTLRVGDERFSAIDAELLLEQGRLSVPWIAADFAGGRLLREKNHFTVELSGEMPFDGHLELFAADVSRLLGDDKPSMRALVGRVDAALGLRGSARSLFNDAELIGLEAEGTVRIQDAKLWSIPVFDKLYSLAVLPLVGGGDEGEAEPPRWTRGAIDFTLHGIYMRVARVELEGEPLILRGEGTLGAERLSLRFYPELRSGFGFVRDLPLVGWVVDLLFALLERQVGAFIFQGPYESPEVLWDPVALPSEDLGIQLERPRTSGRRTRTTAERF